MIHDPEVYPHKFPRYQKRVFFEGLKKLRPGIVEMMTNDDFVSELKGRFGAVFVFKKSEADEIYKAGLESIKEQSETK